MLLCYVLCAAGLRTAESQGITGNGNCAPTTRKLQSQSCPVSRHLSNGGGMLNPVGGGQSGGHVYTWQLWASAESLYTAGALAYSGMWSRGVAGGSPTVPIPLLPLSPPLRLLTDVPGYNTRKFFGNRRRTFWTLKLWTTFSKLSNFN